jgi:hypothetical protein
MTGKIKVNNENLVLRTFKLFKEVGQGALEPIRY